MSRPILSSAVFQWVLAASAGFVAIALALLWAWGLFSIGEIDGALREEINTGLEEGRALYLTDGPDALLEWVRWEEDQPIWRDDDLFEILAEDEMIAVLRAPDFEPVAGFPGLLAGSEIEEVDLDHPEIFNPVLARSIELFDGATLTFGRFIPDQQFEIWRFVVTASIALAVIVLPLSLATGYFLSRRVFRRLDGISETTEAVAAGNLDARAQIGGAGDEFDRLAEGVNRMLDRVAALTGNIEAVSTGVAHDLKTPLANIRGRLELIRRDAADPDAVARHVDGAEGRLDGLMKVFDALLRLGEIEAGKRRQAFRAVDLGGLAGELAEGYGPAFEDAEKTLDVAILPGITVEGDRDLLAQLIANLLDNALEHSRDGARAHIALHGGETGPRLEIGDDGPGIAPAMRERIFERFFRADPSRSTPGNGLGLALVKAIADLHGADIQLVDDRPGAVFVVTFGPFASRT